MTAFAAPRLSFAEDTHPFGVRDMLAMDRVGDPHVSPDGAYVVFTLRSTDLEADKGRTDLWLAATDGSMIKQLTTDPAADVNPRWSADGSEIFFLSSRSGSMQVWRLPMSGGEARQVTKEPLDVGNLVVAPSGKHIAYTMEVFPELKSVKDTVDRLDEIAKQKQTGRVYDKLFFRHWDTWKDGRRSHIFVRKLDSDDESIDIMRGMDADAPSKPFGGPEEITFTPQGYGIVFACRDEGREEAWSVNFDLFTASIDGSSRPKRLTKQNKAWDTTPVFSPDGETLAYLAMSRAGFEADRFRIVLRDWRTGSERVLTDEWDRSPSEIAWAPDAATIYTSAGNLGQNSIFAIDVETGRVKTIVEQGSNGGINVIDKRLLFSRDTLKSPAELFTIARDGSDEKPVTQINKEKVAAARMGDYEQFTFKGWNGEQVHGYVVKPVDFSVSRKYPIAFLIHGGPQGSFGNHFHYRWNPQAYAGAGYAAVMIDFHGSTGYGQAFTDSIRNDWGGKPLEDLKKGLDAALDKYDWLDGRRVSALGASYGGYMINWIAGNWSDRFRCLVNHDGNLCERLAYFDTEELWFPEWEHGGAPWENPDGYEKHNPLNFVKNWKTPMLVIHGGMDYRVVDTQGMSTFTALQRRGIPSKFLYFPDENHWVLKPSNSIQWHETVIEWLDQWTKK
ncbi:MAG: S9 family peptidase [Phycisphaerales bacterium]|nr:S9 family peptidase [Phycisphaerales bacterium]MCB9855425.1 S9 family peptidase [Phycisphaerales bacterium]